MKDIIIEIMPYIVSVICAAIAAYSSVSISRKEAKKEIVQLIKQHEFDLEIEREKHKNELEKVEIEHKHQIELMQKEFESKMGSELTNTIFSEVLKDPEIKKQIINGMKNK